MRPDCGGEAMMSAHLIDKDTLNAAMLEPGAEARPGSHVLVDAATYNAAIASLSWLVFSVWRHDDDLNLNVVERQTEADAKASSDHLVASGAAKVWVLKASVCDGRLTLR